MRPNRAMVFLMLLGGLPFAVTVARAQSKEAGDPTRTARVGRTARIEQLVLPGSELEAKPQVDPRAPLVLRVVATFRHGSDYRYDFEYYGLAPGDYSLADYLRRKDGSTTDDLPSIAVTIRPVLPPGQIEPNRPTTLPSPALGGYRLAMAAFVAVWVLGLLAILFARRRKKAIDESGPPVVTLAERLNALVNDAVDGRLTQSGVAELERLLLAYWRRRLDLEDLSPAAAIATLRRHPEAGELLRQLESWLHRPGRVEDVDVQALLQPYRDLEAGVQP
jgi:hypothetical protein